MSIADCYSGHGGVGRVGGSKHGAIDSEAIRHFKFVAAFSILSVSAQTACAGHRLDHFKRYGQKMSIGSHRISKHNVLVL
jgi:hypothetical protein